MKSWMEKFGIVVVLNCAFFMLLGMMMAYAGSKGVTTEQFIAGSGVFVSVLFVLWNGLVLKLVSYKVSA